MEKLYPLTFRPNIHTALWGRESWEISGHHSSPSVVAEGPLAGRTLEELSAEYGAALTGTKAPVSTRFPLLFKVIDARDRLSVHRREGADLRGAQARHDAGDGGGGRADGPFRGDARAA